MYDSVRTMIQRARSKVKNTQASVAAKIGKHILLKQALFQVIPEKKGVGDRGFLSTHECPVTSRIYRSTNEEEGTGKRSGYG